MYRKVEVSVWDDDKYVALGAGQPDAQKLWLYLLTGPDTSIVPGLHRATKGGMADGIGWSYEGFNECFAKLSGRGMVVADWYSRLVWLPNALRYNWPANQSIVQGWVKVIRTLPECDLREAAVRVMVAQLEAYDAEQDATGGKKKRGRKKKERLATPLRELLDEMQARKAARSQAPHWAPHLRPCADTVSDTDTTPALTLTANVTRMVADASRVTVAHESAETCPASADAATSSTAPEAGSDASETLENQASSEAFEASATEAQETGHRVAHGVPDQEQEQEQYQEQEQEQEKDTHTDERAERADGSVDAALRSDLEPAATIETAAKGEAQADAQLGVEDIERVCTQEHGWALTHSKQALSRIEALCPVSSAELQQAIATTMDQADKPGFGYAASVLEGMRRGEAAAVAAARGEEPATESTEKKKKSRKKKQWPVADEDVLQVFAHYRVLHSRAHKQPNRDSKEWKAIAARLAEGYSVEDLCLAIDGCHRSPFHMGENDRGTKYNSLELITRSGSQVTKFAELAEEYPDGVPQPGSKKRDVRVGYHPGCTHDEHMETIRKYGVDFDGESAVIDLLKVAEEEIHA